MNEKEEWVKLLNQCEKSEEKLTAQLKKAEKQIKGYEKIFYDFAVPRRAADGTSYGIGLPSYEENADTGKWLEYTSKNTYLEYKYPTFGPHSRGRRRISLGGFDVDCEFEEYPNFFHTAIGLAVDELTTYKKDLVEKDKGVNRLIKSLGTLLEPEEEEEGSAEETPSELQVGEIGDWGAARSKKTMDIICKTVEDILKENRVSKNKSGLQAGTEKSGHSKKKKKSKKKPKKKK